MNEPPFRSVAARRGPAIETVAELDALLPALLVRALKGEL